MGIHSRHKGKAGEREIVKLARAAGMEARRTWETAQSRDPWLRACDVTIAGRPAQVKVAAKGFTRLYAALDGVEMAFIRADRQRWLAVLPAERLLNLLKRETPTSHKEERDE